MTRVVKTPNRCLTQPMQQIIASAVVINSARLDGFVNKKIIYHYYRAETKKDRWCWAMTSKMRISKDIDE